MKMWYNMVVKTLQKMGLFWDVDRSKLDAEGHADFVIRRVLARGDVDDIRWALSTYGKRRMRDVYTHARGLDARSHAFWDAYFNAA